MVNTFFYTVPGPKMIWQFGELGYDYSIDYNGRLGEKPVRWDYYSDWRRNYNYKFISELIKLRTSNDAFETEDFELTVAGALKSIKLNGSDMDVVVIGNFDVETGSIAPGFQHSGAWYDYFNGEVLDVTNVNMEIVLERGEYRIYTDVQMETPDIGTGIETPFIRKPGITARIIPNPVVGSAQLEFEIDQKTTLGIRIYNIVGSEILRIDENDFPAGKNTIEIDMQALKSGVYFCVINTAHQQDTIKLIKQ